MNRKLFIVLGGAAMATTLAIGPAIAAPGGSGSTGKTTVDTEVGWDVGSGQFDGEFITAEIQGVVIGLRAQERFVGPLDVAGKRVGVYDAETGQTGNTADNLGTWNYDWHVDVSNAKGNASDQLDDYSLTLEQDFSDENLFGALGSDPVSLPFVAGVCDELTETRCQQSWNPGFGNGDYDPLAVGTYNLRLVLTPETYNGPSLAVAIQVNVTDTDA